MSVVFQRSQQLGRSDLNLFLTDSGGHPSNAYEIYYAIYDFTTGSEILVGDAQRNPQNPEVGEYFAPICIPNDANVGKYRIRWYFRQAVGKQLKSVVQEFEVIGSASPMIEIPGLTPTGSDLVRRLRIMLRDHCIGEEEELVLDVAGERVIVTMYDLWEAIHDLQPPP